jgi:phosphoglucomutase
MRSVSPLAGKPAPASILVDVPALVSAYYAVKPDPAVPAQRVVFGTSGHRGSSLAGSFNEAHILAMTQAICLHRRQEGIDGPLFIGVDTHALSAPAFETTLEVLAANGVDVMIDARDGYTPTPVVSHAILAHNRGRQRGLADGIVITPSHNPPQDGGFKYDPPHGGPADARVTRWIEERANAALADGLRDVKRVTAERARNAPTTHRHDYLDAYVGDLPSVIDLDAIRVGGVRIGVDPLGGASVAYWDAIGERHRLALEVVNHVIDPTFRFMTVDWDGKIRMDPSSAHAMARLIDLRERFDVAFANDTDADRHGIVTRGGGLLEPNRYLAVAIAYLFANRPDWPPSLAVGKTIVSSSMIDRVADRARRRLVEMPVGFKWFVEPLLEGTIGFCGEESAGASFVRRDGSLWTTDKDGIVPNLLAAEITARTRRDPGQHYAALTAELGETWYARVDSPATPEQKAKIAKLSAEEVTDSMLAGHPITAKLTTASGNGAAFGGLKVVTAAGWFAARPSGTEEIYKLYAESFQGRTHLDGILQEAEKIVNRATKR